MNGSITKIAKAIKKTGIVHRTTRFINRHGADIFAIITGVGVVATGVSAYNAGKKSVLQNESDTSDAEQEKKRSDVLALPIAIAAGTIGADVLSRYFGRKREAQALAACAALSAYITRLEGRRGTESECSDTWDQTYKSRAVSARNTPEIEDTGSGNIIFTEAFTGRQFKASVNYVLDAMKRANDIYKACNFLDLNTFYEQLGISSTDAGEILGWCINMRVLDPYLDDTDYNTMVDAITDLGIYLEPVDKNNITIHYPILPIGGLAGVGPCNY